MTDPAYLTASVGGVTLTVRVQPRASRNEIVGEHGDALKIRLTSPPVEGAANRLCTEFVAEVLGVPRSSVRILSGEKGRRKVLHIADVTREAAVAALSRRLG